MRQIRSGSRPKDARREKRGAASAKVHDAVTEAAGGSHAARVAVVVQFDAWSAP